MCTSSSIFSSLKKKSEDPKTKTNNQNQEYLIFLWYNKKENITSRRATSTVSATFAATIKLSIYVNGTKKR
jgi:hypothetical protein